MKTTDNETWVDFLEGELDSDLKSDLSLFLKNHPDRKKELKQMKKLRSELQQIELPKLPRDEAYYDQLASRIIAKVETSPQRSKVFLRLPDLDFIRYAAAVVLVLGAGWSGYKALSDHTPMRGVMSYEVSKNSIHDLLIETSAKEPDAFAEAVMTHRNEEDLYLDATAQKMDDLDEKERDLIIKALKE